MQSNFPRLIEKNVHTVYRQVCRLVEMSSFSFSVWSDAGISGFLTLALHIFQYKAQIWGGSYMWQFVTCFISWNTALLTYL